MVWDSLSPVCTIYYCFHTNKDQDFSCQMLPFLFHCDTSAARNHIFPPLGIPCKAIVCIEMILIRDLYKYLSHLNKDGAKHVSNFASKYTLCIMTSQGLMPAKNTGLSIVIAWEN
jgi:hypothetical protein